VAVFDLDSGIEGFFDQIDERYLTKMLELIYQK